jgi:hypothetical protein
VIRIQRVAGVARGEGQERECSDLRRPEGGRLHATRGDVRPSERRPDGADGRGNPGMLKERAVLSKTK